MIKRRTDRRNFEDIAETARLMLIEGKSVKEIANVVGWSASSLNASLIHRGFITPRVKGEKQSDEDRYAVARMTHIYTVHLNRSDYKSGYYYALFFNKYRDSVIHALNRYFGNKRHIIELKGVTTREAFEGHKREDLTINICVYSFEECPTKEEVERFHKEALKKNMLILDF